MTSASQNDRTRAKTPEENVIVAPGLIWMRLFVCPGALMMGMKENSPFPGRWRPVWGSMAACILPPPHWARAQDTGSPQAPSRECSVQRARFVLDTESCRPGSQMSKTPAGQTQRPLYSQLLKYRSKDPTRSFLHAWCLPEGSTPQE